MLKVRRSERVENTVVITPFQDWCRALSLEEPAKGGLFQLGRQRLLGNFAAGQAYGNKWKVSCTAEYLR